MMSDYNFEKDLALSQEYETKFAQWMKKKGVDNIERAPDGLFEDWDVKTPYGTYEIKYDRWMESTGNFCLETVSCVENSSRGWFFKTKADYIVVFYNETEFVHIKMTDLIDAWFDYPDIWTIKYIQQKSWSTIVWLADCKKIPNLHTGSVA